MASIISNGFDIKLQETDSNSTNKSTTTTESSVASAAAAAAAPAAAEEEEARKRKWAVMLMESLQRLSCHLPQSVLLQCIQHVEAMHKELEQQHQQQPQFQVHVDGDDETKREQKSPCSSPLPVSNCNGSTPTTPLTESEPSALSASTIKSSGQSLLQARQARMSSHSMLSRLKSSRDLFANTNAGELLDMEISSFSTSGDTSSVVSFFTNTADSTAASLYPHSCLPPPANSNSNSNNASRCYSGLSKSQVLQTLQSVENLLKEDMSFSSSDSESETDNDNDNEDDCSSLGLLSSSSESSEEYQLDMEFDLQALSSGTGMAVASSSEDDIVRQEEQNNKNTTTTLKKSSSHRLQRRKTGLQRKVSCSSMDGCSNKVPLPPSLVSLTRSAPTAGITETTKTDNKNDDDGASQSQRSISKLRQGRLVSRRASNLLHPQQADLASVMTCNSVMSQISQRTTTAAASVAPSTRTATSSRGGQSLGSTTTNFTTIHDDHCANMIPKLSTQRYPAAFFIIDISGFTKLSTALPVEPFSEIIHSYFQKIVQQIEMHGGDIQKFAGDAIIAEWKPIIVTEKNSGHCQRNAQQAVWAATLCAMNLVDLCSDYHVQLPSSNNLNDANNITESATLNVHAAVGYGEVVGTYVGDILQRMEHLLLGEALEQVTTAIHYAKPGQVVVSEEAKQVLESIVDFSSISQDQEHYQEQPLPANTTSHCYEEQLDGVENRHVVVASKKQSFIKVKPFAASLCTSAIQPLRLSSPEIVRFHCKEFSIQALEDLYAYILPFIHTVPMTQEVTALTTDADRSSSQENIKSNSNLAELREVCTLFIQPIIPKSWLGGECAGSEEALRCLNQIMWITLSEVDRFQGHLRQFIVDDKGLVIIVNFGLRGSTHPRYIEERAMPFIANFRSLLKSEVGVGCKIGATFGKAYCGLVTKGNGSHRTEYSVIGPSVNLAARLMNHARNPGILVDFNLKQKAGKRPFTPICPVQAKGYDDYVKIFFPENAGRDAWKPPISHFVGRGMEAARLVCISSAIMEAKRLKGGTSRMAFLEGPYGVGKSCLMSYVTKRVEVTCQLQSARHLVFRHVCCDDDSFKPFSIARPLFLEVLRNRKLGGKYLQSVKLVGHTTAHEASEVEEAQMYVSLLEIGIKAKIPLHYVEVMAGLIFSTRLSDIGKWSDVDTKIHEWEKVCKYLVHVFLRCTCQHKLVLLALDNLSGMDEMSWKLIQGFFYCASNVFIIGAARTEFDLNINPKCWQDLNTTHEGEGLRFHRIELGPLDEAEVLKLVKERLSTEAHDASRHFQIAHSVYLESKGNPLIANELLDILMASDPPTTSDSSKLNSSSSCNRNVDEVILNRLDSLPSSVRATLDLGALIGSPFYLSDIIAVMERCNNVRPSSVETPATSTQSQMYETHLQQAVDNGLLTVTKSELMGTYYSFTHAMWQEAISRQNLDSWKDHMRCLVNEVMESKSVTVKVNECDPLSISSHHQVLSPVNFPTTTIGLNQTAGKTGDSLGVQGCEQSKESRRRLRAMAKLFRRTYKQTGRKGASQAISKFKGLLSGKRRVPNPQ